MKKKGNISLLVLFVLVACSLLGIIAVQYIRHMAIQTNQIYNYYKTYYLAKGGSEIGLSLMKLRGVGYSFIIEKNDPFVLQNISTGNAFSLKIQGDSSLISQGYPDTKNCVSPLTISGGDILTIPLFTDTPNTQLLKHFLEQNFYINKSEFLKSIIITGLNMSNNVGIGIIVSSGGSLSELGMFFTTEIFQGNDFFAILSEKIQESFNKTNDGVVMNWQNSNLNLQNYLIIANKDNQEISFCLELPEGITLATPKTYISSFGYVGTNKMGLETIYEQPIPSYLIDSNITQN